MEAVFIRIYLQSFFNIIVDKISKEFSLDTEIVKSKLGSIHINDSNYIEFDKYFENQPVPEFRTVEEPKKKLVVRKKKSVTPTEVPINPIQEEPVEVKQVQETPQTEKVELAQPEVKKKLVVRKKKAEEPVKVELEAKPVEEVKVETSTITQSEKVQAEVEPKKKLVVRKKKIVEQEIKQEQLPVQAEVAQAEVAQAEVAQAEPKKKLMVRKKKTEVDSTVLVETKMPIIQEENKIQEQVVQEDKPKQTPSKKTPTKVKTIEGPAENQEEKLPELPKAQIKNIKHQYVPEYGSNEEEDENIYETMASYQEESILEPKDINGKMFYVDESNYIYDFETKELLGKYSDNGNIIWLNS